MSADKVSDISETLPFTHPIVVETIRKAGQTFILRPTGAECAAIATQLGIVAVESLSAKFKLTRDGTSVEMEGDWSADVVQACGITLEPLKAHLSETVDIRFAPPVPAKPLREGEEEALSLDERDPPEPVTDGVIDPGVLLVELLSLALDPYPRKQGAVFGEKTIGALTSPFAALAKLKGA
jgi:uncharacterized metal-binding protein YceD (DUF177 family)